MPLADQRECEKAALAMGYWFDETVEGLEFPKGCFAHFDDYLYWNAQTYVRRHENSGEICRLKGKLTLYHWEKANNVIYANNSVEQ